MIDLRKRGLPDSIVINGKPFVISTDFRDWLEFGELINGENPMLQDFFYLFLHEIPTADFMPALVNFYKNPNSTPHSDDERGGARLLDYIEDGEYIVGSFQQVYGIDLTSVEGLHWHRFKALLHSLPSDCKMSEIISMRAWTDDERSQESINRKMRDTWALPLKKPIYSDDDIAEINAEFYGAV